MTQDRDTAVELGLLQVNRLILGSIIYSLF